MSATEESDAEYAKRVLIPMLRHVKRYLEEGKLLNANMMLQDISHRTWLKMHIEELNDG